MAQIGILKSAKVTDPAPWSAARRWFLSANKIDTEAPEPLIAYYDSFTAAGVPATPNAQAALLYAYALAPYDSSLRLRAGGVYLRQGKAAEARIAISPVAYDVDGDHTDVAKKLLALLDANDVTGALAEMDKATTPDPDGEKKGKEG
jgi:Flp pilus assembly protein TadD